MYKLEDRVFIKGIKVKGVVKEVNEKDKKYKVTFFNKNNKRVTAWFPLNQLRKFVPYKMKRVRKSQFSMVRDFQKAFNCPAPDIPTVLSEKLAFNRATFILEELIELLHATSETKEQFRKLYLNLIENGDKLFVKQLKKPFPEDKLVGQVDAFTDILYFGNGGFCEMGVVPENIFEIVHKANMGKLFPDGKPHYNEIGKVVKPDDWEDKWAPEPKIAMEIERQKKDGATRFKLDKARKNYGLIVPLGSEEEVNAE